MTTTIPTPERYLRRWKLGDRLKWGSAHRYGEWHRRIEQKPWGRSKRR